MRDAESATQSRNRGWLRSRLGQQDGKHPLFPSKQPQWLVLTEWASLDHAYADGAPQEVIARYTSRFGHTICDLQYHLCALSATLLNENGWTV